MNKITRDIQDFSNDRCDYKCSRISLIHRHLLQAGKPVNNSMVVTHDKVIMSERKKDSLIDYSKKTCVLHKNFNNSVFELILNEPKRLNCIIYEVLLSLFTYVKKWVPNERLFQLPANLEIELQNMQITTPEEIPKVVFMSGMGKAFCAGADISGIYRYKTVPNGIKKLKMMMNQEYLLIYMISQMKPIQIVHWNGTVIGGGVGLSINAPIRIATENTIFSMPEVGIGLFPDAGATWFLPRIFNNNTSIGLFVGLTGHRIKGKQLVECGLATHYIKEENMSKLKEEISSLRTEHLNLDNIVKICDSYSEMAYHPSKFAFENKEIIDKVFKFDSLLEIKSRLMNLFSNGTKDEQKFSKYVLTVLSRVSPTSLVITFEQLKRGCNIKSLFEAFFIESQLAYTFVENHDLFEGIRATMIAKNEKPNWEYKTIEEINQAELIRKYFDTINEGHSLDIFSFLN